MSKVIKIKKGLDINLKGKAEKILTTADRSDSYAVKPTDFTGITPKLLVKPDHKVNAGSPLFFDKNNPDVLFTSPVSGVVTSINRGERRRILEIVIKADKKTSYENFKKAEPADLSREEITENLIKSGLWPCILQRPYSVIANPKDEPKAIFISCFDTAPLAPDYDFILNGEEENFQRGIDALRKLTKGKVHLNVNARFAIAPVFKNTKGIVINSFDGPHPAGNVGIQIHHIDPINKGDLVWVVNPQDVMLIGRLFEKGILDTSKIISITGSEVLKPRYLRTQMGVGLDPLLAGNTKEGNHRYISGNVLTGTGIDKKNYLGFYHSQITIIPEGDFYEMFGWALPGLKKFSFSKTFLSWLTPNKTYNV
ncbi:Na(+)-translocating NADH-quinone reductase subunit A, partial [Bacteroidota bacterium]